MNEVTRDIEALVNMELPPTKERLGRNVVKFTIACIVVFALAALGVLGFALKASLDREDRLTGSLSCVRESALIFDVALADGIKLKLDLDVAQTEALAGVARGDSGLIESGVEEALLEIEGDGSEQYPGSEVIKKALDQAVAARRKAVAEC